MLLDNLSNFLYNYLTSKFSNYRISGDDFMINCIYCKDYKYKLGINLSDGIFHCFICGEKGTFTKLYSDLESLTYDQAEVNINLKILRSESKTVIPTYNLLKQQYLVEEFQKDFLPITIDSIDKLKDNKILEIALKLLYSRKLLEWNNPYPQFYYCIEGKFKNRLIIPYIKNDKIIYFQGRALLPGMHPKYLNPPNQHTNIRPEFILYPYHKNTREYLYICEGPLDARSLQLAGLNATCTQGCHITDEQINALRSYPGQLVIAYNNDQPGIKGIRHFLNLSKEKRIKSVFACQPPKNMKDWNEALVKDVNLNEYCPKNIYELSFENIMLKYLETFCAK